MVKKFEAHSYGLHFSKKVLMNKIVLKKAYRVKSRIFLCKTEKIHIKMYNIHHIFIQTGSVTYYLDS